MRELEKKADKYAYEVYSTRPLGDDPTDDEIKEAYIQGYKDATEWHYPSKGELPDKDGEYLCRYYKYDIRFSKVLLYRVKDNKWYNLVYDEEYRAPKPDAWQYFVPPKEEA